MKHLIFIIGILLSSLSYSKGTGKIAFYEFNLSLNSTTTGFYNAESRLGFGAGINYAFQPSEAINILSGMEYNHTSIFKAYTNTKRPEQKASQVTYHFNNISIPLILRYNMANSIAFIEAGIFVEAAFYSRMKGIYTTYNTHGSEDTSRYSGYKQAPIKNINYGPSLGIGFKIPVANQHHVLIKCDYKLGLRDIDVYNNKIYNCYLRLSFGFRF